MSAPFDAYADAYGAAVQASIDFAGLPHDFYLRAKALLLADVIAREGGRFESCLDVGCGVGALHPHLAGLFRHLAGVDVSQESIARAAASNGLSSYRTYDGRALPYADGSFDLALTSCVMHHVPPADWPAFAAEMARVVRPGGLVAVIEHNPYNPLTRLAVRRCAFDRDAVLLGPGRTRDLLRGAGLGRVAVRSFLLLPTLHPAARRCEAALARIPLGAQYLALGRR
ncbi:class I SAM-dependent methyltransferase [Methylobacterium sp. A54F]